MEKKSLEYPEYMSDLEQCYETTPTNLMIFSKIGSETIGLEIISASDIGLWAIDECEINGKVYKSDSSSTIYIPVDGVCCGGIMNIRKQKKTYFIRARGFYKLIVCIWELPYKENGEYSVKEALEFLKHNKKSLRGFSNIPSEK